MAPAKVAVAVSAVGEVESFTCTVMEEFHTAVGVPVIAPVLAFKNNPAPSWPVVIDQV